MADELKTLASVCSDTSKVEMSAEEIAAVLPRWENAGTVKNTLGDIRTDYIEKLLKKSFI